MENIDVQELDCSGNPYEDGALRDMVKLQKSTLSKQSVFDGRSRPRTFLFKDGVEVFNAPGLASRVVSEKFVHDFADHDKKSPQARDDPEMNDIRLGHVPIYELIKDELKAVLGADVVSEDVRPYSKHSSA